MFIDQHRVIDHLLQKESWPLALEPELICSTDEDKQKRARAILNVFVDKPVVNLSLLDFTLDGSQLADLANTMGASKAVSSADLDLEGEFDIILMYDVLDHLEDPAAKLQTARAMLSSNGLIYVRNHPWCSRHGAHLHSINKAFAHLLLDQSELSKYTLPKQRVLYPKATYHRWFKQADLEIVKELGIKQDIEPFFREEPVASKLCQLYQSDQFPEFQLIQTYCDYILKAKG